MFEIIGLFFATLFLFAFAKVVSAVLAVLTWLCLRKKQQRCRRLILAAAMLPLASAAWAWLCVAILPGESLFGDISEPIPNGYVVEALGKMPDFAGIKDPRSSWRYPHLSECIGELAVDGQLVIGRYSHPCDTFTSKADEPYFIFDTQSGSVTDVPTESSLQSKLGHPVRLAQVQFFRSPLAQTRRRIDTSIEFGTPIMALLLLIALTWQRRRRIDATLPTIYT